MKQYLPVTGEQSVSRRMRSCLYTWIRAVSQVDVRSHARLAHVFRQRRDKNALTYHNYQAAHHHHRDSTRIDSNLPINKHRAISSRHLIARRTHHVLPLGSFVHLAARTTMQVRRWAGNGETENKFVGRLRCSRRCSLRDIERALWKITPFTQCMPGRHKDIDRHVISRATDRFVERSEGQRDGVIRNTELRSSSRWRN